MLEHEQWFKMDVRDRSTCALFLNLLQQQQKLFWHLPFRHFRLNLVEGLSTTHQNDEDSIRTLWKYFFPPETYSFHEVCAKARYINHSAFIHWMYLAVFHRHTSNGVLSSI